MNKYTNLKNHLWIQILAYLIFCSSYSTGQVYQRMLIPKGVNIEIPAGKGKIVEAICLDRAKEVPLESVYLNQILSSSEVLVIFTDGLEPKTESLDQLLGKSGGIQVTGDSGNNSTSNLKVIFNNYTGRPLKIGLVENLQIGDQTAKEPALFHNTYDQELHWRKETEYKLRKIAFDGSNSMNRSSANYLEDLDKKYDRIEKLEKKILESLKNNPIGITGESLNEIANKYEKATTSPITSGEGFLKSIQEDYKKGSYYIFNEKSQSYLQYIRSPSIRGLLYKRTDYVLKYLNQIEEALFMKELSFKDMILLNFLDASEDTATNTFLHKHFENRVLDFNLSNLTKLRQQIESESIKFILCFGHYEEGFIFTYTNGIKHKYSIKMLDEFADKYGVKLIYIGCKSSIASGGGSGTTFDVNSIKILEAIFTALNKSQSLGEFLTALCDQVGPSAGYNFAFEFDEITGIIRIRTTNDNRNSFDESEPHIIIDINLGQPIEKSNNGLISIPKYQDNDEQEDRPKNK